METESQFRPILPMTFCQSLNGAVDEFVDAVEKLKRRFPDLSDEKAMDYAMQLKSVCYPREVK